MGFNLQDAANKYTSARSRRKRRHKIVACLAVVVVCGTIYALTAPAVTLTQEPVCGMEEHEHDENCYQIEYINSQTILDCPVETSGVHTHTGNCYDDVGNLVCGYADFVIHTHDSNCYDQDGNLICTLPEIEEHIHSEECYQEQSTLICEQEESEDHSHDDSCYETVRVLTCGKEEIQLHTHSDACRDENGAFICGMLEVLEHQHTDACIETGAPIEVRELICELPEHIHDEDCFTSQIALFAAGNTVAPGDTSTSVTVKMEWVEDELADRPDSVTVQLLANGEPYGDPVTLNEENGWTYKWLDLVEGPAYTVQDVTVPGYTSSAADTSNSQEQENLLENGGRFVFQVTGKNNNQDKYIGQYLAAKPGTDGLCYTTVLDDYARWDAQVVSNGVYVLTNCGNGMVLGRTQDSQAQLLTSDAAAASSMIYVYYAIPYLYFVNDGSTPGLTNGQYWYFGNDANPWASNIYHQLHETQLKQAQTYNLYQVPSTEVEYTITNTKIKTQPVSVTVTKRWDDGQDDSTHSGVTVDLLADGAVVQTTVLSNENNWTYTWHDMPANVTYTVREAVPNGYSCSVVQTGTASADGRGSEVSVLADGGRYRFYGYGYYDNQDALQENSAGYFGYLAASIDSPGELIYIGEDDLADYGEYAVWVAKSLDTGGVSLTNAGNNMVLGRTSETDMAMKLWEPQYVPSYPEAQAAVYCDSLGHFYFIDPNNSDNPRYFRGVEKPIQTGGIHELAQDTAKAEVYRICPAGGGLVFTITNTPDDIPNLTLHIWKTDSLGQSALSGAQLKLYTAADAGSGTYTAGELVTDGEWTSESTSAQTYSLPDGTYLIEESVAPDGYIPLSEPIVFQVCTENGAKKLQIVSGLSADALVPGEDDTTWTLNVPNSTGFQLPETGGTGTDWYIPGGTLLIGAALLVYKKKTQVGRGA